MQPNPAWVTRILRDYWHDLAAVLGEDAMPQLAAGAPGSAKELKKLKPVEFGTGHYGTVMPTGRPGLVIKVTSDVAEATFVAAALSLKEWPDGIVKYERIVSVPEKLRDRPVFVLWRQEARDVGKVIVSRAILGGSREPEMREAEALLSNTKFAGSVVREAVESRGAKAIEDAKRLERWAFDFAGGHVELLERDPFPSSWSQSRRTILDVLKTQRGAYRVAAALRFFEIGAEMMRHNNPILTNVGTAFETYLEHSILLADVHAGNIGIIEHEDYDDGMVVITDPGHAVFLDNRYDAVTITPIGAR